MSEKNKKTKEFFSEKTNKDIYNSRIGGQVALSGFSYQMLSSCYLILTELNSETQFILEGIEDIDKIYSQDNTQIKTYTQIKYSKIKQDASFMKPILKNFLEVYLCDNSSKFRLIYDFSVAKGNMSKLFSTSLDEKALEYWRALILDIKNENNHWTWLNFNFENFIKVISFKKIGTNSLELEIEKNLIKKYKITTNNIPLYLNGLKIYCWKKMSNREEINQLQLDYLIHDIKDDISKGIQNPAHNWIQRINFKHDMSNDTSYYEGKKPTSQDISNELPIRRKKLEEQVKKSIFDNKVTVIKSSSGQGKTTLALQTAFNLKEEYSTYQLSWCNDEKELNNIIMYFESRIKLGEKLLILIDNLDFQLSGWNHLSQKMQEQISYHYKILITVRELDWYNYAGDISNLKMLNVIKIFLSKEDAKEIFLKLKHNKKLHKSISTWEKSWSKVKEKELLIEYVYLLTHGVMLSDRISEQIIQINKTEVGKIKCEILRILSIADICGVKLSIKNLLPQLVEVSQYDFGEILKSMESEFLIKKDDSEKYIEGLHPVRSQHISNRLHEFMEINDTVISVIKISDKNYLAKLFSNFPHLIKNKKNFYSEAVKLLFKSGLDSLILSLQGVFSGTVMKYYHENKSYFDDADNHSALNLVVADSCPFTYFKEFDYKLEILSKLKKIFPTPNMNYLCSIRDSMSKLILFETDIYIFSKTIFELMNKYDTSKFITELNLYAIVAEWLLNIDVNFNLTKKFTLNEIWDNAESYHLETISKIMYLYFCGNKEVFLKYTNQNLPMILTYLKKNTNSLELYISENMLEIHVKYILLPSNLKNSNEESVNRIKNICKTLPIFDFYCADSITPKINLLSEYNLPNDGHKKISLRNIFIMFHQEFASLWSDTIISNYVFDSNKEWLEFWFTVRKDIILFSQKSINIILKLLEGKDISHLTSEFDTLQLTISKNLGRHNGYPQQNKPFSEEKILPPNNFDDISKYFTSILNFSTQILGVIEKKEKEAHLAIMNLNKGLENLEKMQEYFFDLNWKCKDVCFIALPEYVHILFKLLKARRHSKRNKGR